MEHCFRKLTKLSYKYINMEQGWDNGIKQYFRQIINTISMSLSWLLAIFTAGFYFGLANPSERPLVAVLIFYVFVLVSGFFLVRYLFRTWRK
jgi:membrane protein YdbS with pleckstrin-like domain